MAVFHFLKSTSNNVTDVYQLGNVFQAVMEKEQDQIEYFYFSGP